MNGYWKELKVWQISHKLVLEAYKITASFPKQEKYGLADQIKRAAYSIPANIVEGQSRNTTKKYIQFLYNSRGSLEELRYFFFLSCELGFLEEEVHKHLEDTCETISKMLNGLIRALKSQRSNP